MYSVLGKFSAKCYKYFVLCFMSPEWYIHHSGVVKNTYKHFEEKFTQVTIR